MLIVETGQGLPEADSYVSVDAADVYHDTYGDAPSWSDATEAAKERALRVATRHLEMVYHLRWVGRRVHDHQALGWPRAWVEDASGFPVGSDVVPRRVRDACAYLAGRSLEGETLLADEPAEGRTVIEESVKVGPISETTKYHPSGKGQQPAFPVVTRLLGEFIIPAGTVSRG